MNQHAPQTLTGLRDPTVIFIPNQGYIRGEWDKSAAVFKFLNVPYAVVNKRWTKAGPVHAWDGIRDGTKMGPMCPQVPGKKANPMTLLLGLPTQDDPSALYSERDCLNVNIYIPEVVVMRGLKVGPGVPTVVQVHGGSLRSGGNAHPIYDLTNFVQKSAQMKKPVVAVSINFRMGHLGFFGSKELAFEYDSDPVNIRAGRTHDQDDAWGNWGLHDQKLAFEWVHRNIESFGGSAENLTAMGHSSGGSCLSLHMMMPAHHGLFQRVILQSGTAAIIPGQFVREHHQRVFDHLCQHFGSEDEHVHSATRSSEMALASVDALRSIPAVDLLKEPAAVCLDAIGLPVLDNTFLFPKIPSEMTKDPSLYDPGLKAVIIGAAMNEGSTFVSVLGAPKLIHWKPFLRKTYDPALHAKVETIYGVDGHIPRTDKESHVVSMAAMEDYYIWRPISNQVQALLHSHNNCRPRRVVNQVCFEASLSAVSKLGFGSYHCTHKPFVTMSKVAQKFMNTKEKRFGDEVVEKWVGFIHGQDCIYPEGSKDDAGQAMMLTKDLLFEMVPAPSAVVRSGPKEDLLRWNEEWQKETREKKKTSNWKVPASPRLEGGMSRL